MKLRDFAGGPARRISVKRHIDDYQFVPPTEIPHLTRLDRAHAPDDHLGPTPGKGDPMHICELEDRGFLLTRTNPPELF